MSDRRMLLAIGNGGQALAIPLERPAQTLFDSETWRMTELALGGCRVRLRIAYVAGTRWSVFRRN